MAAQAEPLHDIAHLGSVELFTPKPDKSLWYFRDLLGMEPVHETAESVYLRGYGDYATSTLKLTTADTNGVGCVSWRADSPQALERRAKAIDEAGLGIGWTNGDFGRGRAYRFHDPDGHTMEIYYEEQKYVAPPELHSNLKNLPQKFTGRGVGVRRIDHLALLAKDVEANRKFAQEIARFPAPRAGPFRQRQDRDRLVDEPDRDPPSARLRRRREGRAWPPASLLDVGRQSRRRACAPPIS